MFDLGQNIAGWCRFRFMGPSGVGIYIRHGEILTPPIATTKYVILHQCTTIKIDRIFIYLVDHMVKLILIIFLVRHNLILTYYAEIQQEKFMSRRKLVFFRLLCCRSLLRVQ